ncbi:hypothetical protein BvCmsKKP041_03685 [Escherichia coli]|nr:hypothetical protein BvCmsKKP041_03685 [Escherichia coli]
MMLDGLSFAMTALFYIVIRHISQVGALLMYQGFIPNL